MDILYNNSFEDFKKNSELGSLIKNIRLPESFFYCSDDYKYVYISHKNSLSLKNALRTKKIEFSEIRNAINVNDTEFKIHKNEKYKEDSEIINEAIKQSLTINKITNPSQFDEYFSKNPAIFHSYLKTFYEAKKLLKRDIRNLNGYKFYHLHEKSQLNQYLERICKRLGIKENWNLIAINKQHERTILNKFKEFSENKNLYQEMFNSEIYRMSENFKLYNVSKINRTGKLIESKIVLKFDTLDIDNIEFSFKKDYEIKFKKNADIKILSENFGDFKILFKTGNKTITIPSTKIKKSFKLIVNSNWIGKSTKGNFTSFNDSKVSQVWKWLNIAKKNKVKISNTEIRSLKELKILFEEAKMDKVKSLELFKKLQVLEFIVMLTTGDISNNVYQLLNENKKIKELFVTGIS